MGNKNLKNHRNQTWHEKVDHGCGILKLDYTQGLNNMVSNHHFLKLSLPKI